MRKEKPTTFAVKHKNDQVRSNSRSGGVFTALSDYYLDMHGAVYGCIMSEEKTALHFRATTKEDRNLMRGSKYVESRLGDTFKNVKEDLERGLPVVFSGTSCQVAGLKMFLGRDYNNLLLVDILCHGVPSPTVWKKYLQWRVKKYGKCVDVNFRNKNDFGWADHVETLIFRNGKKVNSRVYTTLFYSHLALRPSCYKCPYKTVLHPGDITIADYWEIERACPGFNDDKGVSLVLINNDQGMNAFHAVKDQLICKETEYDRSTRPSMFNPAKRPQERDEFWKDFGNHNFSYLIFKYLKTRLYNTYKNQLKRRIKTLSIFRRKK